MWRLAASSLIGLALLMGAFAAVEQQFHSFKQCVAQHGTYNPEDYAKQPAKQRESSLSAGVLAVGLRCTGYFLNGHDGALTGISTLLLTVITAGLVVSGIDQGATTRAQLRPYVMVKLTGLKIPPDENGAAGIEIFNRGQTPAHDIQIYWAVGGIADKPTTEDIRKWQAEVKTPEKSWMLLGPNEGRGATNIFKPFSQDEVRDVLDEKATVAVIGRVEYLDPFNRKRVTHFCHLYSGSDLGENGGSYGHYGNSYT